MQIRWNPKNNVKLDFGNVTLKPNVAVEVIKIGTAVDFTVGLYGETSNLYGAKAGLKDNYTLSGGSGAKGGLLGSSGSDGSKGKQANVTIIYR